jgi:hypothetical protein
MAATTVVMGSGNQHAARALDCAAAAILAAAVAYSASALAGGLLAAFLAAGAFAVAFAALARIKDDRRHELAGFTIAPIDPPAQVSSQEGDENVVRLFDPRQLAIARPLADNAGDASGNDAAQALSDALAQLKLSLR